MKKLLPVFAFLALVVAYNTASQETLFSFSADLTSFYTLGNADETQYVGQPGAGAYRSDPTNNIQAKKNGYYTAANLYANFTPFSWLEGYFKIYAVSRPGSFYLPLQMENVGTNDFSVSFDNVFGKADIFKALDLSLPLSVYIKAGKYKAQPSHFGTVSKYGIEQVLFLMHTKTDFTYELGAALESPFRLAASFATNYLLTEAVERRYDTDGGMGLHGTIVTNTYAPQFITKIEFRHPDLGVDAELLYGQNVAGIYSGHSIGFTTKYSVEIGENIKLPVGLSFGFFEKNLDILGKAVLGNPPANEPDHTRDFRNTVTAGLGTGIRLALDPFNIDFNIGGLFTSVGHFYRENLNVIGLSLDTQFTFQGRYFIGGGFIAGTLADVTWKTRADMEASDDFNHTFTFSENFGYEIYAGINLAKNGRAVIGFNQNRGLSLNHMLETKAEGQMKYKQKDTEWSDKLIEAGGLYFKVLFRL